MLLITGLLTVLCLHGSDAQDCSRERRIDGFQCAGRGREVTDCPTGSRCMRDGLGGSFCCWDEPSAVEAPCEDPLTQGSTFVQCTPNDQSNACPGRCYDCRDLTGTGTGLCCPQVNRPGCENSSPMRNAFEAARQRILGSGSSGGSDTFSSGFTDTFGGGSTFTSGGGLTSGFDSGPTPSFSGPALAASQGDAGMSGSPGRDMVVVVSDSRSSGTRFSPSSDSSPECPGGRPSSGRCIAGRPCGLGESCVTVGPGGGVCCPVGAGLGESAPMRPGMPGTFSGSMAPTGSSVSMPGITGRPGMGGMAPDVMAERRDLLMRARALEARRRMMLGRGSFPPGPFMRRF